MNSTFKKIQLHHLWFFLFTSIFLFDFIASVNGFHLWSASRFRPPSRLYADNENDNKLKLSRSENPRDKTLYEILGAQQTDTDEMIKMRYIALVRQLHPDARKNNPDLKIYPDLSDINAAWNILSNPKERLRYDRSLLAKEFTEGLESLLGLGLQTAIPFIRRTADTTVAVVETSSKVVNKSAKDAKKAYALFEVEQSIRQLEQKAEADLLQAKRRRDQSNNVSASKVSLVDNANTSKLIASEAQRLSQKWNAGGEVPSLEKDIEALESAERKVKESLRSQLDLERKLKAAERQVEQAAKAEELAKKRLEEAQQALARATLTHEDSILYRSLVAQDAMVEKIDFEKWNKAVDVAGKRVRLGLTKKQEKHLGQVAADLMEESKRFEESAKKLKSEALSLEKMLQKLESEL